MRFKKLIVNLMPVVLSLGLVYCNGPGAAPSNLKITNTDAEGVLKVRLNKTQEIRHRLKKIIKALSSTEAVINTVYYNLRVGLKLGTSEQERLLGFATQLKTQLRQFGEERATRTK